MPKRKLTLSREVLQELSADELAGIAGGTRETLMSCYTVISCWLPDCIDTLKCID